jgi:hypothetical protein
MHATEIKKISTRWRVRLSITALDFHDWKEIHQWIGENLQAQRGKDYYICSTGFVDFAIEEDAILFFMRYV